VSARGETVVALGAGEAERLRTVRLDALRESPRAFLSTYEDQRRWDPQQWRDEVGRGRWLVGVWEGEDVGLVGATPEADIPVSDRYLSYLWVRDGRRRRGLGSHLVMTMLDDLRDAGVPRAWLWVLGDNVVAMSLYKHLGFAATGDRQPLAKDPTRYELRMARFL
jgi:ribosomal protein S18 acetylase RimI-like enzyme